MLAVILQSVLSSSSTPSHRRGPGQDGHGPERGADHPVQLLRAGGHARRQALPHVAHRGLRPNHVVEGTVRAAAALRGGTGRVTMLFKDLRLLTARSSSSPRDRRATEIDSPLYALDPGPWPGTL